MPKKTKHLDQGAKKTAENGHLSHKNQNEKKHQNGLHLRDNPITFDTSAHKFELQNPHPVIIHKQPEYIPNYDNLGELPQTYGSKKLYLVARDPHWIYAYWDLSYEQFQSAESSAHDHKVFLQIYLTSGERIQQIQISPGSRDWYIHVSRPDASFFSEIGYYNYDGHFEVIARSGMAVTPRDGLSWKTHSNFVTIPFHFSFKQLFDLIRDHMLPGEELAEALARLEAAGFPFPFDTFLRKMLPSDAHQKMLEYLGGDILRRIKLGSIEITELLKKQFSEMVSSGQWMGSAGVPGLMAGSWTSSETVSSWSSPSGGFGRSFYMHVNAELIIYGGTDPKAKVKIDGKHIDLRPDGTFSYHFVFPDGRFHIPIEAESPDKVENRSAMLSFARLSDYIGDVQKTGQPPLQEPIGRKK
jgi:hypothetical protein